MANLDRIKEEIGWLKVVFAVCVALDATLIGWLAQNYTKSQSLILVIGCFGAVLLSSVVTFAIYRTYQCLDQLRDL